ncbi:25S rRNA (cytosine(2278)-C(5))-methyltransferase [Malassezia sp. CBS 17886]|nr:25S rRNA (cytosine(2278)-C(5))-methyltransferase [Malassezia sp. CBS 17886]
MADFYLRSARALHDITAQRSSIKAATAHTDRTAGGKSDAGDAKRMLALVVNTLSFREALQTVLDKVAVATHEQRWFGSASRLNKEAAVGTGRRGTDARAADAPVALTLAECLLLVLTHDLLFATRGIQAARAWPPRERLEKYRSQLHAELVRLQLRRGKARPEDLRSGAAERRIAARIPRWCRVNTLKVSVEESVAQLRRLGWELTESDALTSELEFAPSRHVPSVFAFHPRATSRLMGTQLFTTGGLILQDLASCFPAAVLDPSRHEPSLDAAVALDATSAPGNKTSHLSALMQGTGSLVALERAPNRYKTLVRLLGRAGCLAGRANARGNVEPRKGDFLALQPTSLNPSAQYLLLDPSCSGSGIVNRLDYLTSQDDEQDNLEQEVPEHSGGKRAAALAARLSSLAALQERMVCHAMTFPELRRFTYSTCSIHKEENEYVVCKALSSEEAKDGRWMLAPRADVLPTWPERGHVDACGGDERIAESMVRCTPGGRTACDEGVVLTEATNGFFVCCFVRKDAAHPAGELPHA